MNNVQKGKDSLRDALAASFQAKPPTVEGEKAVAVVVPSMAAQELDSALPVADSGLRKTTVSFQAEEQQHIDNILGVLLKIRRYRGGFSDAVKVALRLCPLDEALIGKAWDEARAGDRRTKRPKRA